MKKAVGIVFFISWLLCGCSVESFFCGGAPATILFALVVIGCAAFMGEGGSDGKGRK